MFGVGPAARKASKERGKVLGAGGPGGIISAKGDWGCFKKKKKKTRLLKTVERKNRLERERKGKKTPTSPWRRRGTAGTDKRVHLGKWVELRTWRKEVQKTPHFGTGKPLFVFVQGEEGRPPPPREAQGLNQRKRKKRQRGKSPWQGFF